MRWDVPDYPLAMTILWLWVAAVCTAVAAYKVFRWWRRRHPLPKHAPSKSYANSLRERLDAHRTGKRRTKKKPRATGSPPRAP